MAAPSLAPLRNKVFARFWVGSFISNVGTIMEQVALGIYVQQRTGQAAWNGAVAALGFLPTALLSPFGGVLADRVSRRRLLVVTTTASLLLAAVMTAVVATEHGAPLVLAAISFGTGCANALGWPAFQSMLPDLVGPDELIAAVGLSNAQWNLARVVGPALAGITVAVAGVTTALAVNTASFLAVLGVLAVVQLPGTVSATAGQRVFGAIAEGWRYVRHDPPLWTVLRVQALNCVGASAYIGLIAAVARKVHGGGEGYTAVLSTAMGVGAVSAAFGLGGLVARVGVRRVLAGATVAMPVMSVAYALAPSRAAAALALAALAFSYMCSMLAVSSLNQMRAPAALRGRVLSISTMALGLLYPIAVSVQGRLGDAVGLRKAIVAFALAHALVIAWVRVARPRFLAPVGWPADRRV